MKRDSRIEFAIQNFFQNGYFDAESDHYLLEETEEGGKSRLNVVGLRDNFCQILIKRTNVE